MGEKASFIVRVTTDVRVTVDPSKFDEEFMQEFRDGFFHFDTLGQHAEHIGRLYVRDLLDDFTEGYGPIKEMGIEATEEGGDVEIISLLTGAN